MATSNAANDGIVVFGEGYTEYFFYKRCINYMYDVSPKKPPVKEIRNVEGFGNFIHYPQNYLKGFILPKNKGINFHVFLCYDTDVFDFKMQPNIDWNRVKKEIKTSRITHVAQIEQKYSIEDWIIRDIKGVLNYLGLPANTPIPTGRGIDILKNLYNKAHRLYIHGEQRESQKLINALDFKIIIVSLWNELSPFLSFFGITDKSIF